MYKLAHHSKPAWTEITESTQTSTADVILHDWDPSRGMGNKLETEKGNVVCNITDRAIKMLGLSEQNVKDYSLFLYERICIPTRLEDKFCLFYSVLQHRTWKERK